MLTRNSQRPQPGTIDSAYLPLHFSPLEPPPLNFQFKLVKPLLYLVFLLICNVLIPCLLYYLLRIYTPLDDKELIGIGSAALGISSCFDAPFRMWKLTRHRAKYGPLYYPDQAQNDPVYQPAGKIKPLALMPRNYWHLDFFMWTYTIGLFTFAIPLAVAPAVPLYDFFLFATAMLVAPIGIVFLLTLKSYSSLPFWMSSDPPRTPTKPAVYYFVEDVGAVDFSHGREWRKRMQARYASSPLFRTLCWQQTLYWFIASMIYVGCVCAIIWAPTTLQFAFGFTLGFLWIWMLAMGIIAYFHVHWSLKKEKRWWRATYGGEPGERAKEMRERQNLQEKEPREGGKGEVPEIRLGVDADKRAQEQRDASGEGINSSPV
ncbi:hypothetical protein JCM5296_000509 [Sporobolomyces johnsonii]